MADDSTTDQVPPVRWKDSRTAGSLRSAGKSLSSSGKSSMSDAADDRITPVQYKHGGRVKKTGPAILHKNERVIPASKRKKVERMMKHDKMRMKTR